MQGPHIDVLASLMLKSDWIGADFSLVHELLFSLVVGLTKGTWQSEDWSCEQTSSVPSPCYPHILRSVELHHVSPSSIFPHSFVRSSPAKMISHCSVVAHVNSHQHPRSFWCLCANAAARKLTASFCLLSFLSREFLVHLRVNRMILMRWLGKEEVMKERWTVKCCVQVETQKAFTPVGPRAWRRTL